MRTCDLRAVFGAELAGLDSVVVTVVANDGRVMTACVELADLRAGARVHRAMVCPDCRERRRLLIAREGALKCSNCHRHRTRRQMERHRASWNRLGGELEDRLLRLLGPTKRPTPTRLKEARRLASLLLQGDVARVARLRDELSVLTTRAAM